MPSTLGRASLIAELVGALRFGEASPLFWEAVRFVGKAWRPRNLEDIATAAADVQRDGTRLGDRVVTVIARAIRSPSGGALAQPSFQIDVVQVLVRCQVSGVAAQISQLLPDASNGLMPHLLYVLWVLGDPAAEKQLWSAFSSRAGNEHADVKMRVEIVRTIATCATGASRDQLMGYIRTLPWNGRAFDKDVLLPLVRRGVLFEQDLASIAQDHQASEYGREVCIKALAAVAPDKWAALICGVLADRPGAGLERECLLALANMGDQSAVPLMRDRLREIADTWPPPHEVKHSKETQSLASVAAVAALALAVLGNTSVVPQIEAMIDHFPGDLFDLSLLAETLGRLKAPSSLPILLRLSEHRESRHVVEEAIEALGVYLPNADAQEKIITALNTGFGGVFDRGSQLAAMRTLARHDPNLLLEVVTGMSPLGHLDSSARQWLALHIDSIGRIEGVDSNRVVALLTSLACDRDYWVREMVYQAIDRVPSGIVERVTASLSVEPDAWRQACAVRLSGTLEVDDTTLKVLSNDRDPIIRDAAEAGLAQRQARRSLSTLIELFGSADARNRAAALFALEAHADEWAMWRLADRYPEDSGPREWFNDLAAAIQERRRREHQKVRKAEDRTFMRRDPAVTIW